MKHDFTQSGLNFVKTYIFDTLKSQNLISTKNYFSPVYFSVVQFFLQRKRELGDFGKRYDINRMPEYKYIS